MTGSALINDNNEKINTRQSTYLVSEIDIYNPHSNALEFVTRRLIR